MFNFTNGRNSKDTTGANKSGYSVREMNAMLAALNKSQAIIQFKTDGTILDANQAFLDAMGYRMEEIQGKHHRIFVEPGFANSKEYKDF